MTEQDPRAYFVALGDGRYRPTEHAGGAWSDAELHLAPVAGLLTHHMDHWQRAHGGDDKLVGRIAVDVLGQIGNSELQLETRVIRPGRTIELLETTATINGRLTLVARTWLLSIGDTTKVEGSEFDRIDGPFGLPPLKLDHRWPGGYIRSLEMREATQARPGRNTAWLTTDVHLVAGEETSELAAYVKLLDTANGIAVRESPTEWMFPNLDLSIHLFRQPRGRWVGFDTTVSFGPSGQGLTSTVLHDVDGPVGTVQQVLTVRRLPTS